MKQICSLGCLCFLLAASGMASAAEKIVVLPSKVELSGPSARQQLLVEFQRDGKFVGQAAKDVQWTSSDPKIVAIDDGVATSVGDGKATLTAKFGDQTATAEATVAGSQKPLSISFRNQVQSVLTKAGCNSGACHAHRLAAGKNGFKLSLRGYDADTDFNTLTRQDRGRRVTPSDPGRSLMLIKPSGGLPHKGGLRFEVDSPDYNIIAQWIAQGTPAPKADDPRMVRLEVLPASLVLKKGATQQLTVWAHFSDGHVDDVTRWAKFTSTNESVLGADQSGKLAVVGNGEAVVSVWYLSQIAIASVSATQEQIIPQELFSQSPRNNFIDELILAKLESLNIPPSPQCTDAEFLRRAYVDTIGVLPTPAEVRKYLADPAPDKRTKLIDELLARPEYVDYWAYKFSDLMLVNSERLKPAEMWTYYRWIRSQVADNVPWDEFARKVVTATGSTLENGAANFFALHQDPTAMAETTSQAFLGMSINCAKCHNHPMEKWTNDQYYAMANLYARVKIKNIDKDGGLEVFPVSSGDLIQPRTGHPQPACPLDGVPLADDSPQDRREYLAKWLTAPENPYFSRAITNRIWANFMGVGLVEAVDDLRLTNPASNEQLLAATAKYLVDNKYDLKKLMRTILQSAAYQRSSQPLPANESDHRFYSRYYPRRMMAEVLLDAISQVSGTPSQFMRQSGDAKNAGTGKRKLEAYPEGWRSMQLPDSNVASYFLKSFGRPQRELTCSCERADVPSMVQVLHISNGDTINEKLSAPGSVPEHLLAANTPDDKIVEDAYLAAVGHFPSDEEKAKLVAALAAASPQDKRQVVEDLFWSLLSSKEFLFNH